MHAFWKGSVVVAAVLLVATQAYAQRGGGRGPGQFGAGNLMLLGQKSVQQELKLSDEQVKKVDTLQEEQRASFAGLRDLDQQERRAKLAERIKTQDEAIKGLLNADQGKRFKQITWQQRGAIALGEPDVAEALALTGEQKDQLMTIERAAASEMRDLFQGGGGGGDREANRKKMQEARAATNEKALGVLTAEQKDKWKALTGEPFKGEIVPPARRGRPGGAERSGNRRPIQASSARNFFHLASFAGDVKADDKASDIKSADDKPADKDAPKARGGHKHRGRHAAHASRGGHGRGHGNGDHVKASSAHHRRGHARHVNHHARNRHDHANRGSLAHSDHWNGDRYAARGRYAGFRHEHGYAHRGGPGQHGQFARGHFSQGHWGGHHGPSMASRYRHAGPHGGHYAWHGYRQGPGSAQAPQHDGWRDGRGPQHHPHHHMASWHRGPQRPPMGPAHFRGPHGPQGDGPRDFGPEHRRPDGPQRPNAGSDTPDRDVESQLTEMEHKLEALSRQLAQALEMTRR